MTIEIAMLINVAAIGLILNQIWGILKRIEEKL